jgi:hypothetical protein
MNSGALAVFLLANFVVTGFTGYYFWRVLVIKDKGKLK